MSYSPPVPERGLRFIAGVVGAGLLSLCLIHCGDDGDEPVLDTGPSSDSTLFKCSEPGKSCNAHDKCAINPICGKDYRCHPSMVQNCDDGLACTDDSCGGPGMCNNKPKQGSCALLVKSTTGGSSEIKCLKSGDPNPADPCQQCDPTKNTSKWSSASGKSCDDSDTCTMNDVCSDGFCKGTYFGNKCSDGLPCTEDICDGKGGCSKKLKSGNCVIGAKCYKAKETDAGGCAICDPSKTPFAWTPLPNQCKIGLSCYKPGDKDITGCGVCEPKTSTTAWSPSPNTCVIAGACHKAGEKSLDGCGACDPKTSVADWTPTANSCRIQGVCHADGAKNATGCGECDAVKAPLTWTPVTAATTSVTGFEVGLGGYTVDAPVSKVGWQVSTARFKAGKASLYYGNPAAKNYDNGAANKGAATGAAVTLPAGKKAALQFWLYADTEPNSAFDKISVKVGTAEVWVKSPASVTSFKSWVPVEIDLSAFAGTSVKIGFHFDSVDSWANSGEGVYIDDVTLMTNCGP